MSAGAWDGDLADLARNLGQQGSISPGQAEMLERLLAEVSSLTGGRARQRGVLVRTAVALTAGERSRFEELLGRRFGKGRRVAFEVDPELLGGVWLRVGDRIVDSSLRGRLRLLRRQMGGAATAASTGGRE